MYFLVYTSYWSRCLCLCMSCLHRRAVVLVFINHAPCLCRKQTDGFPPRLVLLFYFTEVKKYTSTHIFSFSKIYLFYGNWVICLNVCIWTTCIRRGGWISENWSYRHHSGAGNWIQVFSRTTSVLNHWASLRPHIFYNDSFLNKNEFFSEGCTRTQKNVKGMNSNSILLLRLMIRSYCWRQHFYIPPNREKLSWCTTRSFIPTDFTLVMVLEGTLLTVR